MKGFIIYFLFYLTILQICLSLKMTDLYMRAHTHTRTLTHSLTHSLTLSLSCRLLSLIGRYVKRVKRDLERIEKIIRLVIGPVDLLVESYKANFPDHNESELVKIMDLKVLCCVFVVDRELTTHPKHTHTYFLFLLLSL
jgi:hypothetical protein